MTEKLCACGCTTPIPPGRADRVYVDDAHKQAAYRTRAAATQRRRRTVTEAAVAERDLGQLLAAAVRSTGPSGTAWLKAGARMHTLTAAELARLAELAGVVMAPGLAEQLSTLAAATRADREQLAPVVGAGVAGGLRLQVVHAGQVLGELALEDVEQLAALARVAGR